LPILLLFGTLLSGFLICGVRARGGNLSISPLHETTEKVQLSVSDEVLGNLSVSGGAIDFYITSPSEKVLLTHREIEFAVFNFTAKENGNYTLHLSNVHPTNIVNATLSYAVHFKVYSELDINIGTSVGTVHVIGGLSPPTPTIPLDWIEILKIIGIGGLMALIKVIIRLWERLQWWRKYRKSRTPVAIEDTGIRI